MNKYKTGLIIVVVIALIAVAYFSFFPKGNNSDTVDNTTPISTSTGFNLSDSIDENGLWEGISALEYVKLCNYKGITIPASVHNISDEAVQEEINKILADYATEKQITDRPIADGDTVNIDYVGKIDGVEFEGGSTEGSGTEVTIGVTEYIDDFIEQLIGHTPGETFDIEVTFPEDYGVEELNGKDAVFTVTINYIVESELPELNDDFVKENLAESYGWNTVEEMKSGIRESLKENAIFNYIQQYLIDNTTILSLPESLVKYQENSTIKFYQDYADYYSMTIDEFLNTYVGVTGTEELLSQSEQNNTETATLYLIIQAIAEDAGIKVTDEDVTSYFSEYLKVDDFSQYEEFYGMPYLKLMVINQKVMDYIKDNAVLE